MNRRKFLYQSGVISTSALTPGFLSSCKNKELVNATNSASRQGKVLVVIQLSGGNDGLNTFVPYRNDIYYQSRPDIAVNSKRVIKLTDDIGLHPILQPLQSLYDDGLLSVVNNVGYPNPDRSHFKSLDIWHSGFLGGKLRSTGWIGRYLDSNCSGCDMPHHAIELDDTINLALKGIDKSGFALKSQQELHFYKKVANSSNKATQNNSNNSLDFLYKTLTDTESSADYIIDKLQPKRSLTAYPDTSFAQQLKLVSELMTSDINTKIYYVSVGGFDTHVGQINRQKKVLDIYAQGVAAFVKDL